MSTPSPQLEATQIPTTPILSRPVSISPPDEDAKRQQTSPSFISSQSATARPRRIAITPVTRRDAPRSPGGSTIRPVPIKLFAATEDNERQNDDNGNRASEPVFGSCSPARRLSETPSLAGSTTIRPSSYANLLNAYADMVNQLGDNSSQPGSLTTLGPRSFLSGGGGGGVGRLPNGLLAGAVDELQVEWCILCGNPRDRQKMELRGFRKGERGLGGEEGGDGFWWFCVGPCPNPLQELNREL